MSKTSTSKILFSIAAVALTITKIFTFPDEIAAGIILIGSCPNGLASNVMTYLAGANLALSVTLTAISTVIAPFVTPFFIELLAGQYIEIDFWYMVLDITKIVIIPVSAGLIFNYFLHGKFKILDDIMSGYFLGYWSGRLLRMSERDCRTIAIEVGLQNAGLGSGLALSMGKLVGLPAAIFAPVMNITAHRWRFGGEPERSVNLYLPMRKL
jgi:BASS family bile acid:Na+ symporter